MANRSEAYRFRDGKTQLSAAELNARFFDLDSRIGKQEDLAASLDASITDFTQLGLERLTEVVQPQAEAAQALIDEATALIAGAQDPAQRKNLLAYTGRASAVTVTYDGNGNVDTVTETHASGVRTIQLGYSSGVLSSIVEEWNGVRRTEILGYDGNGQVISITATETAI